MVAEYDPETCWTASELRGMRVSVPDDVPDVAWVPKSSLSFGEPATCALSPGGDSFEVKLPVTFTVPFRWIEMTVTL